MIIDDSDILNVCNILSKNFECTNSYIIDNISLSKEELDLNFIYYTFNICVEIKTSNKFYLKKDMKNKEICYIDDVPCHTFNNEYTLINLISHHYFMTENIYPIKYSNRFILQYLIDIKKLMDSKKINIANFQKLIDRYKMKYQMYNIILRIREIFNDYNFGIEYMDNKMLSAYIDGNHFISYIDKYFNKDEIICFIKKYCLSFMTFDLDSLPINNEAIFYPNVGLKQSIKFKIEKDNLVIILNSMTLTNNQVLYVCLYCYDVYGEYCTPYIPIAIKLIEGVYKYYIGWSIDINSCSYDVYDGLYKDVNRYIKYANSIDVIEISIDTIKFANAQGRINLNKTVSLNAHLLEIKYKTIISINSLVNKFNFPLKLKCN